MADKLSKLASKYIPANTEKKIKTYGAKTSAQLKSKADSLSNVAKNKLEMSRLQLTGAGKVNNDFNAAKNIRASNKSVRQADYAENLSNQMRKSVVPMINRENAAVAKAKAVKLSMAPMDATGVARNSAFPLAESPIVPDYSTLTSKLRSK